MLCHCYRIPKVKIVKNLLLFLYQCTFTIHRPRLYCMVKPAVKTEVSSFGQLIALQAVNALKNVKEIF